MNVDLDVVVRGEKRDADIIAQVTGKNQVEDKVSADEKDNEKPLLSAAEAKIRRILENRYNIESYIYINNC